MSTTIYSRYKNIRGQDVYIIPKHIESFGFDTKETVFITMISGEKHMVYATVTSVQSTLNS